MEDSGYWPTRDHIIPRAMGGRLFSWNRVIVCWSCNNEKGGWTLEEFWLACREFDRREMMRLIGEVISERFVHPEYRAFGMGGKTPGTARERREAWRLLGLDEATAPTFVAMREDALICAPAPYQGRVLNSVWEREVGN